jgi:hypothetical protein
VVDVRNSSTVVLPITDEGADPINTEQLQPPAHVDDVVGVVDADDSAGQYPTPRDRRTVGGQTSGG